MSPSKINASDNLTNLENSSSNNRFNGDYLQTHSAVRTPPPGFTGSGNASTSLYAQCQTGIESAPPLPGFCTNMNDQNCTATKLVGRSQVMNTNIHRERALPPSSFALNGNKEEEDKMRSKSYVNLAVALGEGLAESMGDSLFDGKRNSRRNSNLPNSSLLGSQGFNNSRDSINHPLGLLQSTSVEMGLDNIARQTRHSLSRVAGRSTESPSIVDDAGPYSLYHTDYDGKKNTLRPVGDFSPFLQSKSPRLSNNDTKRMHDSLTNLNTGVGCIVEEPRSGTASPIPIPQQFHLRVKDDDERGTFKPSNNTNLDLFAEASQRLLHLNINPLGRASAPPKVLGQKPQEVLTSSSVLHYQPPREFQQSSKTVGVGSVSSNDASSKNIISNYSESSSIYTPKYEPSLVPDHNALNGLNLKEDHYASVTELAPFLWDLSDLSQNENDSSRASRALIIIGASCLPISEVRSTCEAFGSLLYFRPEFCQNRGVILLAYHDMRSARHAAKELNLYLQRLSRPNSSHRQSLNQESVNVMYCVDLTSSTAINESTLKLSNLPQGVDDKTVNELITSFGAVKSIHFNAEGIMGGGNCASYTIEFYDIQDANQALLEIQSTAPWGSVKVSQMERTLCERKQAMDLLSLIGRWRRGETRITNPPGKIMHMSSSSSIPPSTSSVASHIPVQTVLHRNGHSPLPQSSPSSSPKTLSVDEYSKGPSSDSLPCASGIPPTTVAYPPATQVVVGPDQFSYIVVNSTAPSQYPPNGPLHPQIQPVQQHFIPGHHGSYVVPTDYNGQWIHPMQHHVQNPSLVPQYHHIPGPSVIPGPTFIHGHAMPVYTPLTANVTPNMASRLSSDTTSNNQIEPNHIEKVNEPTHLSLNIESVKTEKDKRTSLMVRNIPNKYTQNMLLSEFQEGGHGPGKIDFFYLPIDFKNKCNRGYAFVNFVDFRDVVRFHEAYNGKPWKIFKSDKICDITYARIQGKAGMMKRFQNSALMEKDHEYRPLVFASNGENKGKLLEFPSSP